MFDDTFETLRLNVFAVFRSSSGFHLAARANHHSIENRTNLCLSGNGHWLVSHLKRKHWHFLTHGYNFANEKNPKQPLSGLLENAYVKCFIDERSLVRWKTVL